MDLDFLVLSEPSDQPVYRQVADLFSREIEEGRLRPGDRLPAIRRLADVLGIHRDTVALAYEQLAGQGYVAARVGRGTFVASRSGLVLAGGDRGDRGHLEESREETGDPEEAERAIFGAETRRSAAALTLAAPVEALIALENTRPRYATGDDVIALHRLIPDARFYPTDAFRRCMDEAMAEDGPALFSYASPEGDPRLRRAMVGRLRRQGVDLSPDELVLCHGASQGISLALRLFTTPGDQVAVEVPTYANVLSACAGVGVGTASVAMDEDGPEPEALDRVLARPEVKAFYTIPSFHNPLGTTSSLARRHEVLRIARRHAVPVIEDGFEMDLRFRGRDIPSLAALDETGLVVLLFSFSKSLFPGIRVGSISARGRALEGLVALKHATDLSDALPIQAALARFLESGEYDRHLRRMRSLLRARHAAMNAALASEMPAGTRWTRPDGGYQLWLELPFEVDTRDVLADAARAGVLFSPGTLFMPDARPSRAMRLTVACADEDEIRRGVAALGEVVRPMAAAEPGSAGRAAGMHL